MVSKFLDYPIENIKFEDLKKKEKNEILFFKEFNDLVDLGN
jgi:hypothetical protein